MDLSFLAAVGGPKVVGGVLAAIVALWALTTLMKPKPSDPKTQHKVCGACGWQGRVTLFKPKCPQCAAPL